MANSAIGMQIPQDRAQLLAVQARRRGAAMARAGQSPFYKGKLEHLDLARITDPDEWLKIPVLDKDQLRAMDSDTFYRDFCIAPQSGIVEYWRSGGSTGRPLFYPRTAKDIEFGLLGFMRVLQLAGLGAQDTAHMALPLGIHPAGHLMARAGSRMGVAMVWAGGGNTLASGAQLDMIRLFKPSVWIGMASYAIQLANLARAEGFDLSGAGIDKIICTAEPLSVSKRARLSGLWGAEVRDSFGMTEMMMLGGEDGTSEGFRFWSDFCYPEVLDEKTLEPVADGEPGLLVVTALVTNNATPFVRWNTGDIVTMQQGADTGSPYDVFPLVRHTHRTAGFIKVRGINIGFTDFEDLMFGSPLVGDFRVEAMAGDGRDELVLHVELTDQASEAATLKQLGGDIKRVFGLEPKIVIAGRGEIAKTFEGSFKPPRFSDRR